MREVRLGEAETRTERRIANLRVLIVRVGAMGDVLHALPAVTALRRRHPDCWIGWAVDPRWEALLGGGAVVDRVHQVPAEEWKKQGISRLRATLEEVLALRRELRAERYDLVVDLQGTMRSAVVGWMAGAKDFVGRQRPRERMAGWLYRRRVGVSGGHVASQWAEVLSGAVGERLECAEVELPADAKSERWAEEMAAAPGSGDVRERERRRFVLIAPGAGWGAKRWPTERYGEVARRLVAAGFAVLVNAASQGSREAHAVVEESGGAARVAVCSVAELVALGRRASLVIAGDTGPLHIAAALGRPVVAIFGPTDPVRNGPFGGGPSRVLRDPASVTDHSRREGTEAGLTRIGVDEVMAAAMQLLGEETNG